MFLRIHLYATDYGVKRRNHFICLGEIATFHVRKELTDPPEQAALAAAKEVGEFGEEARI